MKALTMLTCNIQSTDFHVNYTVSDLHCLLLWRLSNDNSKGKKKEKDTSYDLLIKEGKKPLKLYHNGLITNYSKQNI